MNSNKQIKIDKSEVLRYLGYHKHIKIDAALDRLIDACITEATRENHARTVYKIFDIRADGNPVLQRIHVLNTGLALSGASIFEHLKDCGQCAIMAATLGVQIDAKIHICEKTDMAKALILDACATDLIERVCDTLDLEIKELAKQKKYLTNFRFSPGYGDLPLDIQGEIIRLLDAPKKIGLTVNENFILLPRKSVTAIIGFGHTPQIKQDSCDICSFRQGCQLRKDGRHCGK